MWIPIQRIFLCYGVLSCIMAEKCENCSFFYINPELKFNFDLHNYYKEVHDRLAKYRKIRIESKNI